MTNEDNEGWYFLVMVIALSTGVFLSYVDIVNGISWRPIMLPLTIFVIILLVWEAIDNFKKSKFYRTLKIEQEQ